MKQASEPVLDRMTNAKLGEEFVFNLERHRLTAEGRDDLASRVQWVSQTIGDGLAYLTYEFLVRDA